MRSFAERSILHAKRSEMREEADNMRLNMLKNSQERTKMKRDICLMCLVDRVSSILLDASCWRKTTDHYEFLIFLPRSSPREIEFEQWRAFCSLVIAVCSWLLAAFNPS